MRRLRAIQRKLLRDLWLMRGQAVAIVCVIVSGVATLIMCVSTHHALELTRATFYRDANFADVFASLKRAPLRLSKRFLEIPGVQTVDARVVASVRIEVDGFPDPVTGIITSVPEGEQPRLNRLHLKAGRLVAHGRENEVVISEAFAEAHSFEPGDTLHATINGRRRTLVVVGVALSPEHIYQIRPGAVLPDFERYAVVWMGAKALSSAYDMEGAFNNIALTLSSAGRLEAVIDRVDDILERYGGLGAYGRKDQLSHRYLQQEFEQLEAMARIFPTIFLSVAAFLLHVVFARHISTQREQIAALKAFGYSNFAVGIHYLKSVLLITSLGAIGGIAVGVWMGRGMSNVYLDFYRLPFLRFELRPSDALAGFLVSAVAATIGALQSVRRAASLPPAEAMRPQPPAKYRVAFAERFGFGRLLSQPSKMILRNIERHAFKSVLSVLGLALASAIIMVGSFQKDAVDFMIHVQFRLTQHEDVAVAFVEPSSRRSVHELKSLPGVEHVEGFRSVPARLRYEHRSYRTSIQGLEPQSDFYRLLNADLEPFDVPEDGVVLTDHLGKMLGIRPGDRLTVEVLEGRRPTLEVEVAALVKQFMGVAAYMRLDRLQRQLREGESLSGAYLGIDSKFEDEVYTRLKERPRVASTEVKESSINSFYETMGETLLFFTFINTLLAASISFGVVYNTARVALSERSRELASLRVLGFTRAEVSYILLGELALLTLIALPVGAVVGRLLCAVMASSLQTDLFRVPLVLTPQTYAFAATVLLIAAILSALIVQRRLQKIDILSALKVSE